MSVTLESALFMGKNCLNNCQSIANTTDLTFEPMFDTSSRLVSEQDEIYGVKTIDWENSSWKYLSLTGVEQVISLLRIKVYVFSDSVLCFGEIHENTQANIAWEDRLVWFTSSPEYTDLDRIDGRQRNSSGISSQDSMTLFPQTSSLRIKKLCRVCLEITKQWSRWSLNEGGPTMRHDPRTHRVALGWLFDLIYVDPKIQILYIDTKNQLADILQRKFHTWWVESFVVLVQCQPF